MSTYPSTIIFAIDGNYVPGPGAGGGLDALDNRDLTTSPAHASFRSFLNWNNITALPCNGAYNGVEEACYIMNEKDFEQYVLYSGWVRDQESVLHVTGCNKMYATLRFLERDTGLYNGIWNTSRCLGSMQQVSEAVARSYPSWTHNTHNNAWYITAHRNPDHSNEILPYNTRTARKGVTQMSTYPSTIIFAINENNTAPFRSFLNWHLIGAVRCNGAYNGVEEVCYSMNEKDFEQYVLYSGWVRDQESVLHVTGCNKMYATLRFLERDTGLYSGTQRGLGSMQQVSEAVARSHPSWIHNTHNNAWYITAHRNPDHSGDILPYGEAVPVFDIHEAVPFHCVLDVEESMMVAACGDSKDVILWWDVDGSYSVHLSPDTARAMGERLIAIADKLEKIHG